MKGWAVFWVLMAVGVFTSCSLGAQYLIGYVGPLSGPAAEIGGAGRNSLLMFFERVNSEGGIGGRPLKLMVIDDEGHPGRALEAFQSLESQGVRIIIAQTHSGATALTVPYANEKGLLILSPTVATDEWMGQDDFFLRIAVTNGAFGKAMAQEILPAFDYKRPAFLYDFDNELFARFFLKDLKAAHNQHGHDVVLERHFSLKQPLDFVQFSQELKDSGADSLVSIASPLDNAMVVQQLRKRQNHIPFLVSNWTLTPDFLKQAGSAAEGVVGISMTELDSQSPAYLAFAKEFEDLYRVEPAFTAVLGYEMGLILREGLKQAPDADPASLKRALLAGSPFPGLSGPIGFDKYGDGERPMFSYRVQGGRFVRFNP